MTPNPNDPKRRLAFALDVPGRAEAVDYIRQLEGHIGCFKVGLELFTREGPDIVRAVRDHSAADVFLDLKLHDIPATVRGALRSALSLGARYITVHAAGGEAMLEVARDISPQGLRVLAVTVLTSLGEGDLPGLGFPAGTSVRDLVLKRAALAHRAGLAGVVCSGQELKEVKERFGDDFLAVVPGIRPAWSTGGDDQSRVITPAQAMAAGADLIVVGRPIRNAADPRDAAARILDEMAGALPAN